MNAENTPDSDTLTFRQLGLPDNLLAQLNDIGYERPSPIQEKTIPIMLDGRDLLGQAQTGTGKTAAFALPALARLDPKLDAPQVLVLTPTRELSIQVAEAFQTYAAKMPGFSVLPVYGGQDFRIQVNALKRGVSVVVGTPGRLMDQMRRGILKLDQLKLLVLDEADEMLRMGFIDDVQWILEQTPSERQIALFSATMPAPVKKIANKHLNSPVTVELVGRQHIAETIRQRYWPVQGLHKLDALTRILQAESTDGVIVFVRTKLMTSDLAEKLAARGMRSAALNGEIPQKLREQTVDKLRRGQLDVLVATDVAARGLDVDRISHVINYDIPYDTESYVHRIGRTGRAGRHGEAIMFVAPRERRMLGIIEKAIGARIHKMVLPTQQDINERRMERLSDRISNTIANENLKTHKAMIERYLGEHEVRGADVAAALAFLLAEPDAGSLGVVQERTVDRTSQRVNSKSERSRTDNRNARDTQSPERNNLSKHAHTARNKPESTPRTKPVDMPALESEMERFRLEVGTSHGVAASNIVGAIANEAGIDSQFIGRISIHDSFSLVDLPEGMPKTIFKDLQKARVCGAPLRISRVKPGFEMEPPGSVNEQRKPKARTAASSNNKSRETSESKTRRKPKQKKKTKNNASAATKKKAKAPGNASGKNRKTARKKDHKKSRKTHETAAID